MSAVGRGLGEEQERRDGNELGLFLAGLLLSPTHLSILLIFFFFCTPGSLLLSFSVLDVTTVRDAISSGSSFGPSIEPKKQLSPTLSHESQLSTVVAPWLSALSLTSSPTVSYHILCQVNVHAKFYTD